MIPFRKMHGIGNDFVMVDAIAHPLAEDRLAPLARSICDRRFGVGSDGLILLLPGRQSQFEMRMFNPDGSESEMCGNGVRCFAKFVRDEGYTRQDAVGVDTGAGPLTLEIAGDGRVRVDMGPARLTRGEIGMAGDPEAEVVEQLFEIDGFSGLGTAVSMGNPHLVFFVERVAEVDLARIGPLLERHPDFPRRTNVHFVEVLGPGRLRQRTWERGAGMTLACGTGACACAVAAVLTDRAPRRSVVQLPGGELEIEYAEDGRVFMTGPAETVFDGEWPT